MARDKLHMSKDITKEGPEKHTVSRGEMRDAAVNLVAAGVSHNADTYELTLVLDMIGFWDQEFVSD